MMVIIDVINTKLYIYKKTRVFHAWKNTSRK